MSDRSLDEFLTDDATAEEQGPAADDAARAGTDDAARPTMRWTADGAACAACEAVVARRWRQGETFVCAECKEW